MTDNQYSLFCRIVEKVQCIVIVFLVTPFYFFFMITLVRVTVVQSYNIGLFKHIFHIILSTFCFINVFGNMLMSITTDSSLKRSEINDGFDFCIQCKMYRPTKSWHCRRCNVCILRRDHHCVIFSRCIGLYNQRYYVLYLAYLALSLIYSTYYSYYFVAAKFKEHCLLFAIFRMLNPYLRFIVNSPWSLREAYILFLLINVGLIVWTGALLIFHLKNALTGVTCRDSSRVKLREVGSMWKQNFVSVFGVRWYYAIIWPFANSPLPLRAYD